jgi:hypothetical protein
MPAIDCQNHYTSNELPGIIPAIFLDHPRTRQQAPSRNGHRPGRVTHGIICDSCTACGLRIAVITTIYLVRSVAITWIFIRRMGHGRLFLCREGWSIV